MPNITLILSGLALLAASVSLILIIREKKRNEERNVAFERYKKSTTFYIDKTFAAVLEEAKRHTEEVVCKKVGPVLEKVESIGDDLMDANSSFQDQLGKTLGNIMAFDPLAAQRKARNRAMGMGEDD
jgi:hypothetical protein